MPVAAGQITGGTGGDLRVGQGKPLHHQTFAGLRGGQRQFGFPRQQPVDLGLANTQPTAGSDKIIVPDAGFFPVAAAGHSAAAPFRGQRPKLVQCGIGGQIDLCPGNRALGGQRQPVAAQRCPVDLQTGERIDPAVQGNGTVTRQQTVDLGLPDSQPGAGRCGVNAIALIPLCQPDLPRQTAAHHHVQRRQVQPRDIGGKGGGTGFDLAGSGHGQ